MTDEQLNGINEWSLEGEYLHTPKKTPGSPGYNPLLDRDGYCYYDYLRDVKQGASTNYENVSDECNEFLELLTTQTVKVPGIGERFERLWNEAKSRIGHPLEWEHWNYNSTFKMKMEGYCLEIYNSSDEKEIENLEKLLEDLAETYDNYEKIYPIVRSELEKEPTHLELRNELLEELRTNLRSFSDIPDITFENNVLFIIENLFSNVKGDISKITPDYIEKYIRNDCEDLKERINEFSGKIRNKSTTDISLIQPDSIVRFIDSMSVSTGFDKIYPEKLARIEPCIENGQLVKRVDIPLKRGANGTDDIVIPVAYQYTNGKGEPNPWENRILETAMSVMLKGDPESIKKGRIDLHGGFITVGRTSFLRWSLGVDKNTDVRPQMDDFIKTLESLKERTCEVCFTNLKGHTILGVDDYSDLFSTLRYPLLDYFSGRVPKKDGSMEEVIHLRSYPITEAKDFYTGQKKSIPYHLFETPKIMRSEMKSKTQDLADEYKLWNNPKSPPEDRYIYIQGNKTNALLKDWIIKQIIVGPNLGKNRSGTIKLNLSEMYSYLDQGTGKESSKKTKSDRRKIAGQYLLSLMEKEKGPIYGFKLVKKPKKNEYEEIVLSVPITD